MVQWLRDHTFGPGIIFRSAPSLVSIIRILRVVPLPLFQPFSARIANREKINKHKHKNEKRKMLEIRGGERGLVVRALHL